MAQIEDSDHLKNCMTDDSSQRKLSSLKEINYSPKKIWVGDNQNTYPSLGISLPQLPESQFLEYVKYRKLIPLSYAINKSNKPYIMSDCEDWYLIGTIVHKPETKMSSKGKPFAFWKLRNLNDDPSGSGINDLTVFLFGQAFKEAWKISLGTIVAILNPEYSTMDDGMYGEVKGKSCYIKNATFCLFQFGKILELGQAKYFGKCTAICKNGNSCTTYINTSNGSKYCVNHLQMELKKCLNKRLELNPAYGSSRPMTTLKNYKKQISSNQGILLMNNKRSDLCLNNPKAAKKPNNATENKMGDSLQKLVSLHGTNFNQNKMIYNRTNSSTILRASQVLEDPQYNSQKNLDNKNVQHLSNPALRNNCLYSYIPCNGNPILISSSINNRHNIKNLYPKDIPKLGTGFEECNNMISINLDDLKYKNPLLKASKEKNDLNSVKFPKLTPRLTIIPPYDPNSIKPIINKSFVSKILNKVSSQRDTMNPKKKSKEPIKVLGSVMSKEKLDYILNKKSSHIDIVEAQKLEQQEQYFNQMQSQENIQTSMEKVMEMKCRIVTCKKCKYTFWSASQNCRSMHPSDLIYENGTKRFYQCKDCKARSITFLKFPDKACTLCGTYNYERIAMYKSYDDGILGADEKLLIRGSNESKFLNSVS